MAKYIYRVGARVKGVSAQVAGDTLTKIKKKNKGALTPEKVVEESRNKDAPLHDCFIWNNTEAANLYREERARHLIRSVQVVIEDYDEGESVPVRAFVHVEGDDSPRYVSTKDALSDPELRQEVLERAMNDLRSWRERYKELNELADIFMAMDTVAV